MRGASRSEDVEAPSFCRNSTLDRCEWHIISNDGESNSQAVRSPELSNRYSNSKCSCNSTLYILVKERPTSWRNLPRCSSKRSSRTWNASSCRCSTLQMISYSHVKECGFTCRELEKPTVSPVGTTARIPGENFSSRASQCRPLESLWCSDSAFFL